LDLYLSQLFYRAEAGLEIPALIEIAIPERPVDNRLPYLPGIFSVPDLVDG